jgi:hypothetical protein
MVSGTCRDVDGPGGELNARRCNAYRPTLSVAKVDAVTKMAEPVTSGPDTRVVIQQTSRGATSSGFTQLRPGGSTNAAHAPSKSAGVSPRPREQRRHSRLSG